MIAAALMLVASWSVDVWVAVPPRPETGATRDPDEVVVNGTRVRRLELRVKTDRKTRLPLCTLKRPSGDPKLDAALCAEVVACDPAAGKRKTLQACIEPRVGAAIRARYPDREIGQLQPYDRKP